MKGGEAVNGNYTATVALSCMTVCILGILVYENARFDKSIDEHVAIIDNILNQNYDKAIKINNKHLTLAKNTISSSIETL